VGGMEGPVRLEAGRLHLRGPEAGDEDLGDVPATVVEVVHAGGHAGIAVSGPAGAPISDLPESYGNADVTVQPAGAPALRVNTQSMPAEVLYGNFGWLRRWAWSPQLIVGITMLVLILAALLYATWQRERRRRRAASAGAA
jgi:hypothetical protein